MANMLRVVGMSLLISASCLPELMAQEEEVTETEETVTEAAEEPTEAEAPEPATQEPEGEIESPKWEDAEGGAPEEPAEEKPVGADEVMGIDTVDIAEPQGNWLYKRVWWERAEAKFEKIREVVNKILEFRTNFFAKRAELDKNVLDPFYIKIGISQGELQEILSELIERVEQIIAEANAELILEKAEADKKALQDLQERVAQVQVQDEEVEKALLMLLEQIAKVRNIEQEAWQDFKNIARVLDDKKARELFYKVDAAWRNIKELQNYIENTFLGRFDMLIMKVKEEISRVEQEMNALSESGIDLKRRLLSVERQTEIEPEEEEGEEPTGFFRRYIIDPLQNLFQGIWSLITWPYRALFGPVQEPDEQDMEEPEEVIVEQEKIVAEKAPQPEPEKAPEPSQPEKTPAIPPMGKAAAEPAEQVVEEVTETEKTVAENT